MEQTRALKRERRMEPKTSFVGGVTIGFKAETGSRRMDLVRGVKALCVESLGTYCQRSALFIVRFLPPHC